MKLLALIRRLHFPLMLMLGVMPLVLMLISYVCTVAPLDAWLFPCAGVLLCALCLCLPGRVRLAFLALSAVPAPFLPEPALRIMVLVMPVLCLIALPYAGRGVHGVSPFFYVVGIGSQLLTQFLLRIGTADGAPSAIASPANTLFVLYLILLLLALNRISTDNAALARYHLPVSVRRVNTLLTLAFTAVTLLLTFSPSIVQGIHAALQALRRAISAVGAWIMSLLYTPETQREFGGELSASIGAAPDPIQPPSQFAIIMEYIASVLAAIVLIAGMLVLLRAVIRLMIRTGRQLIRQLHRFSAAVSEDYVDEITDTRTEDGERKSTLLRRSHQALSYPNTPQGAIRRHYARLLRRHPQWPHGSTARENLEAASASIYERARYSNHPITREDADAFARTALPLSDSSPISNWRKNP